MQFRSYTTFVKVEEVTADAENVNVKVTVTNTGTRQERSCTGLLLRSRTEHWIEAMNNR